MRDSGNASVCQRYFLKNLIQCNCLLIDLNLISKWNKMLKFLKFRQDRQSLLEFNRRRRILLSSACAILKSFKIQLLNWSIK